MLHDLFYLEGPKLKYRGEKPQNQREAFDISIAKWEVIRDRTLEKNYVWDDGAMSTCGLCMRYYDSKLCGDDQDPCMMCPIFSDTDDRGGCNGTPYDEYHRRIDFLTASFIWIAEAADIEVNYLKALKHTYCGDDDE